MELLLKRVLVMIITISVAAPALYYTMSYYHGSQYEKNPVSYIPSDSPFIGRVSDGYGIYYAFVSNNSVGIITSISVFMIPELLNHQGIPQNVTENTTLEYFEEYRGISIFKLEGVNATSLLSAFLDQQPAISLFVNMTYLLNEASNLTFFIASPENTLSIMGNEQLVKDSIDSHVDKMGLSSVTTVKFDTSSNLSLYYFPVQVQNLNHLSMNLSQNRTEIYLSFNNLNSTTVLTLSTIAGRYGLEIYIHENSVELVSGRGLIDISRLIVPDSGGASLVENINI